MSEASTEVAAHAPSAEAEALRNTLYGAFAQNEDYLVRWRGLLKGDSSWAGFNWSAALLGMLWCFYRKMYWLGIAAFVAALVLGFLTGITIGLWAPELLSSSVKLTFVTLAVTATFIRLPLGLLANRLYFGRASDTISACVERGFTGADALVYLRSAGGTSFGAMLIALAATIAARFLLVGM